MANKKINQLVAKTTIQSTDLFPIGDATTGTLYKKTIADLQAAIGGAVISVNGLVGTVVLDADDILETATPTNRYFTDARARAAISLTTSGSSGASTYSPSTGVLNVPTYTLAGLGGITSTFLSGGTGITYNSGTGVISYSGTVYTDSSVRALFSGGTGITYNSSTGAISYSGTVYTDSSIRALFSGTSPITYNSTTGAIGITGANLTESTSSVLTITGGTGALLSAASIQVKQASGSQSGFLSSTDWTTFNNKQNTLTNPVTGTGTSGYHTKFTGTSTIANSVIYDDGTSVGIGTTSPDTYSNIGTGIGLTLLASGTNTSANLNLIGNGTGFGGISLGNATIRRAGIFALDGSAFAFYTNATNSGTSLTERMRISSSGQILIGTSTNSGFDKAIVLNSVSSTSGLLFQLNGVDKGFLYSGGGELYMGSNSNNILLYTNGSERMRITSGGSVGIGVTSPQANLHVLDVLKISNSAQSQGNLILGDGGSTSFNVGIGRWNGSTNAAGAGGLGYFAQGAGNSGGHYFYTGDAAAGSTSERMRITPGGNILMGTTTDNGERLYVSGSIRATGTITANSDITLKKNLAKIENALEKVEQINGYTYEFKTDDSKRHAGVIAQEIEGVLPEIVNKGNDGLLGVEYGNISALLIEAIKEQQKKIQELEVKLIALGQ
jgi:hypothetical protein